MADRAKPEQQHFLVVSGAAQGQITPARRLARLLASRAGVRATLAVPLSALRRMFPSRASSSSSCRTEPPVLVLSGADGVAYAAFSDGFDDGFQPATCDGAAFVGRLRLVGPPTLTRLALALRAAGAPVTCVVYTLLLPFAADVARGLGVPAHFFWTMPAAALSLYHHYFHARHGLADAADRVLDDPDRRVEVPGLEFLRAHDLPSLLTGPTPYLPCFREMFHVVEANADDKQPLVLVNTFDALEKEALASVPGIDLELVPVGPMVGEDDDVDLFEQDDEAGYMRWLDAQADGSVVYVSFGSIAVLSQEQLDEIRLGLDKTDRPFLWVLRRDNRDSGSGRMAPPLPASDKGMVVEWCAQSRVLAHRATGCFVTHCGWNSTVEAVACGVPMVTAPQWSDQPTNARMAEALWGVAVRAEPDGGTVVRGAELARRVEAVMGDGEEARAIRRRAREWKARAVAAVSEDGTMARNLRRFVQGVAGAAATTERD
ncbi:hypothetical protein PR202_gb29341 [Eleusine coracana subsp. coracana]|uniref:Glycosyltransferase n=1 Tax=Eleusine coracana subsp. coracana TaxID=191504 RepID=A0AAV5FZF0_ELECO|nr:hypothetical protein PR202_gb29341 [Eleusine coracana subsp. coracana]